MKSKFASYIRITAVAAAAGIVVTLFLISTEPIPNVISPKGSPVLHDETLAVDLITEGLDSPTSMSFIGNGSILVLKRIVAGSGLSLKASF